MSVAPRYPLEGVVSWNMNTTCNYRCSYCTQRFVDDRTQWARDLPRFVQAFCALPGDWEVKLSGGEPFRHPRFMEGVAGLAAGGVRVSVVTNLSAADEALDAFVDATAAKPGVISASLHREYVDDVAFRDRVLRLAARHAGPVVTTCVATRANLPHLERLQSLWQEAGLRLWVQPEKVDRELLDYSPAERELLRSLGGHNGLGHVAAHLLGRPCWAGARYLIVDHRGDAYRCYPARKARTERLGNVLDGSLTLARSPTPCRYDWCNCTVPQARGMVHTDVPPEVGCPSPDA